MERIVLIIVGAIVFAIWLYVFDWLGGQGAHAATLQATMILSTIGGATVCKCRTNGEGR